MTEYQASESSSNSFKAMISASRRIIASNDKAIGLFVDMRANDNYTAQHCERVATLVYFMSTELKLDPKEITTAAFLHDIGKQNPEILCLVTNGENLTETQRTKVRTHILETQQMLIDSHFSIKLAMLAASHHNPDMFPIETISRSTQYCM